MKVGNSTCNNFIVTGTITNINGITRYCISQLQIGAHYEVRFGIRSIDVATAILLGSGSETAIANLIEQKEASMAPRTETPAAPPAKRQKPAPKPTTKKAVVKVRFWALISSSNFRKLIKIQLERVSRKKRVISIKKKSGQNYNRMGVGE